MHLMPSSLPGAEIGYSRGLDLWKDYILVAAGWHGLAIVHADTGQIEARIPLRSDMGSTFARAVKVTGDLAVVALGADGVAVVHLPTGTYKHLYTRPGGGGDAYTSEVMEGKVYVANGTLGLAVMDPHACELQPLVLTQDTTHYGQAVDLAVLDGCIVIANAGGGLAIFDSRNQSIRFIGVNGKTKAVATQGEKVFLWSDCAGLMRFDSNPSEFTEIDVETPCVHAMSASEDQLYLACGYDGITRIDQDLGRAERIDLGAYIWDVAIGDRLYAAAGMSGIISVAKEPHASTVTARERSAPTDKKRSITVQDLELLRKELASQLGFEFHKDRGPLLTERIGERMNQLGIENGEHYLARLRSTPAEQDWLVAAWTINSSWFYRDGALNAKIMEQVLSDVTLLGLGTLKKTLRVWIVGCAWGQEPLGLIMEFLERNNDPTRDVAVLATDISECAIEHARRGYYVEEDLQFLPGDIRAKYFENQHGVGRVGPQVLSRVTYRKENLLAPSAATRQFCPHLILCRNVMNYLDEQARKRAIGILTGALEPAGYLALDQWFSPDTTGLQLEFPGLLRKV